MPHVDLNKPGGAKEIQQIFEKGLAGLMRMATIEFYRQVTISTPVDTGRARAGWFITLGKPSDEVIPEAPQSNGGKKTRKNKKKKKGGKKKKGTYYKTPPIDQRMPATISARDTVYVTNNTPYIQRLNEGYSEQAPARFVETAAAKVQSSMKRLWRKTQKIQNEQSKS